MGMEMEMDLFRIFWAEDYFNSLNYLSISIKFTFDN